MKERKNNVNTLLWLMVTLSVMMMFLTLSSCKSSVQNGNTPNPGPKTVKITVIAPKEGGSIKVNGEVLKETKAFNPTVGDTLTFEAVPSDGYKFKGWAPATLGNKETFELTVDKNLSVSVEFGPIEKEPLTVDALKKELMVKDDSPIVTSPYGLGLIKEGDQFKYQMLENGKVVAKTGKELINMLKNASIDYVEQSVGPNLGDEFKTLPSILDAKWNFAKNSEKILGLSNSMFFFFKEQENSSLAGMYQFIKTGCYFAYKNGDIHFELGTTGTDYFVDWTIAFVEKNVPNKDEIKRVYVFSVNDKDENSKAYFIRKGYSETRDNKYLPALLALPNQDPKPDSQEYCGMNLQHKYIFSLKVLLKEDVQRQISLVSKNGKYFDNCDIPKLSEDFSDDIIQHCDIYINIGDYYNPNGEVYTNRGSFRRGWRNVFKLTDSEFWDKCINVLRSCFSTGSFLFSL